MQYIVIVECVSSGILYIDEIISRGYRPLVVNTLIGMEDVIEYREIIGKRYADRVEYIDEKEDYDAFLKELERYDIVGVFPGSEYGVPLADRLNKSLGLRGNDPETTRLRFNKAGMYEALGRAGIRRIESAYVTCEDDIRRFWEENDLNMCVLKYTENAGTMGLKICSSVEDAVEHLKVMKAAPSAYGVIGADVLIQEYIGGTEYIVDTLSCDGEHMLTDVWVYSKVRSDDGTLAYDSIKLVKDLEPGHNEMIMYTYSVLNAVGMRWGICHTEIKIDEKGPVLIETNARPLGLAMTQAYLDEALGYHLTDMALETYLNPQAFKKLKHRPYSPLKYAMMKLMIVPNDFKGSFAPMFVISNMISSMREVLYFGAEGISTYHRTVDIDTSPMTIKMINSDYGALIKDYETLRLIESNYFHLFYTLGEKVGGCEPETDINEIIKFLDPGRRYLVVRDGRMEMAQYGKIGEIQGWQVFDGAIFAQCGECTTEERYRAMFKAMYSVRSGGYCIVVPESYRNLKSGSVVTEFIMNLAGAQVMAPSDDSVGVIYGVKK